MDPSGDSISRPAIRIRRTSTLVDRHQDYTIVLDGERAGVIRDGEQVEIAVTPGTHRLHLEGWRWHRSEPADVVVDEAAVAFECGPSSHRSDWALWPESSLLDSLMDLLAVAVRDPASDQIELRRAIDPDTATAREEGSPADPDARSDYMRLMDVVDGRD